MNQHKISHGVLRYIRDLVTQSPKNFRTHQTVRLQEVGDTKQPDIYNSLK